MKKTSYNRHIGIIKHKKYVLFFKKHLALLVQVLIKSENNLLKWFVQVKLVMGDNIHKLYFQ